MTTNNEGHAASETSRDEELIVPMLERDLDRIASQLTQGILNTLRDASIEDLAEVLPQIRRLLAKRPPERAQQTDRRVVREREKAPMNHGALGEQILRVLTKSNGGMRSEELQSALHVATLPLRTMLAEMLTAGKIQRQGQARGTRYFPTGVTPAAAPPPEPEVVVDVEAVNGIRAHLAGSTVPLSLHEIEQRAELSRPQTRAALEKLIALGFASRHGHGPGVRYHLATRAPERRVFSPDEPPRVVRRPPRAKAWTATDSTETNGASQSASAAITPNV